MNNEPSQEENSGEKKINGPEFDVGQLDTEHNPSWS